jgi:hypothetical protein
MPKGRFFLILLIFSFCSVSVWAQGTLNSEQLFSPSAGQKFYEMAYELASSKEITSEQAEQAIIFLNATINLDSRANYVLPDMIKLASQYSDQDHSELLHNLLVNYTDESADLEVIRQAARYLLERLDSREQREQLLENLLKTLGGKNAVLDSELATLLGLLMAEKTDFEAAASHLMRAYDKNKYNKLAFAKLTELVPEQLGPTMYLEHLRLALGENPLDIKVALAFAQYAKQLQLYDTAVDAYEYCAELFEYLYPSQDLPASIYLPWMISSYNTQRSQHKCLQILKSIRQSGRFDLFAEAIAGKAAAKIGDTKQARQVLRAAEEKARQLIINEGPSQKRQSQVTAEQLAWFYCFAVPDADNALDWANKAYSAEPNSPVTAAILAYSLVMNGQANWAKTITDHYEHNQITTLTLAQIQLHEGEKDSAIETLKSAITEDPAAFEAERAKEILVQHGGEYIPPIDPDMTLAVLRNTFGKAVVPAFISPEKIISVQLNVRGSKFSYGSNFGAAIAITNNSPEPLVISDDGLFTGNIRIDADITGDLNKKIPNLVSVRISPASPLAPGKSLFIPLRLFTAELRRTLLTYPQAAADIEFTVYLDPVTTDQGQITNSLLDIKPLKIVVKRPAIELTSKFLRNRFSSLTKGRQGQKIKTAQLFTGLLAEQHAMANREPLYKFMYADWMPDLLKSALVHNLTSDDWVAKVHTMADMVSLPLDYELINAAAENLNDTHWPTRLMAVYLLAKSQGDNFNKVLDWTAKYDSDKLLRDMAIALGAAVPQDQESPNLLTRDNSNKSLPTSRD